MGDFNALFGLMLDNMSDLVILLPRRLGRYNCNNRDDQP
jgi:hypothetical protein